MTCKVLITGGTGALGRALVARMQAQPDNFTVFAPRRAECDHPLDLRDADQISRTIARLSPDMIIHVAATFSENFQDAYLVNVAAAQRMLELVEASGRPVRVMLIGSAAEYGQVAVAENPISEMQPLRPVSVYGLTKAWQTELGYLYANRGVDIVVARIFNLSGPNLSERLFVGRLHKQIGEFHRGERTRIEVGSLSAIRDYLPIHDAVSQLLAIANHGDPGGIYHVASGVPIAMRDLLLGELAAHGLQESIVVEGAGLTNRRGYDVPAIYADITRTTALLRKLEPYVKN